MYASNIVICQNSKLFPPKNFFNPFSTNVPLLYPLKTSENRRFCDVFRGYRSATLAENGLIMPLCMRNRTSLRKVLWNKKLPLYLLTQNLSLTQDVFKFISLFLQIWWFSGNNLCLDWNGSFISFSNLDTIFSSEKWEEPIKVHPNILELAKASSTFSFFFLKKNCDSIDSHQDSSFLFKSILFLVLSEQISMIHHSKQNFWFIERFTN